MLRLAAIVALLAVVIAPGCAVSPPTAGVRLVRYFELEGTSSTRSLEERIEERLPIGTPEADVLAFLRQSGIVEDAYGHIHGAGEKRTILCLIRHDPRSFERAKTSYQVGLRFDKARRLESIEVKSRLTGP